MKKRITAIMITLAMLCSVSCNGNTNTSEVTDVTTADVTTATTETTTVGDGASTSRVETTETTETTETEETFDYNLDSVLAEYPVYDAVSTSYSDIVHTGASENVGGYFALRFTDAPGCALLFRSDMIGNNGGYDFEPITAYAFGQTADLTVEDMHLHSYEYGFAFSAISNMVCVGNYPSYYIVSQNDTILLDGSNDVNYRIFEDSDTFSYSVWSKEYEIGQQTLGELTRAYNSDNDFVCEYGRIDITDNGISLIAKERYNAGEWYKSDRFFGNYKKYRELPGCETFAGLVTMYKDYISSRAFEEYEKFEDWVNYKKG